MAAENFVALLGTKGGPAIRPGSTNPSSSVIDLNGQMAVVDCGLGVTRGLVDQGIDLRKLSLIFITHLHSDHYLELGPLLHTAWTAGLKTRVEIFGPEGLGDYWKGFLLSMKADIELRQEDEGRIDLEELVAFHVLDEGEVHRCDAFTVTAIRNAHPPIVESFALAFKTRDRNIVFSGDTAPIDAMVDFARGADLLIHEAMLEAALDALMGRIGNADDRLRQHWLRSHTFAHDVGKIAAAAGVRRLALNHLIPSDDPAFDASSWEAAVRPHFDGELIVGHDGLKISI